MGLKHPIDQSVRERVRALVSTDQKDFADRIGRSQGWLNKWMHGSGKATIDDLVRIAALFVGREPQPITSLERRLWRIWRRVPEDDQLSTVELFEAHVRHLRRARRTESGAKAAHTSHQIANKGPGRRRGDGKTKHVS